jgi:hypothetical protein
MKQQVAVLTIEWSDGNVSTDTVPLGMNFTFNCGAAWAEGVHATAVHVTNHVRGDDETG